MLAMYIHISQVNMVIELNISTSPGGKLAKVATGPDIPQSSYGLQ